MSDSEPIVNQASAMGYESATYPSAGYDDVKMSAASVAGAPTGENVGDLTFNTTSRTMEEVTADMRALSAMANGSDSDASQHVSNASTAAATNEKLPGIESAPVDASQVSASDVSLNGNNASDMGGMSSVAGAENGIISDDGPGSAPAHQPFDGTALSAEEERLWSIIRANSLDFSAWTALIDETEKMSEGNIMKIQKVYDAFLAEFPLCYGYWKKYADHEARIGSMDKVVEVYERAVQGVTYSVDMWLHYCVFAISTYGDPETIRSISATAITSTYGERFVGVAHQRYGSSDEQPLHFGLSLGASLNELLLRRSPSKAKVASVTAPFEGPYLLLSGRLFERGLAYVGTDYLSFPLWDKYIEYEYTQQDWSCVAMLYTRVLENPNQQLDRYFEGFKELVASRPLSELRTAEEAAAAGFESSGASGQEIEGELNPNSGEQSKPVSASLKDAEELEKYIAVREEIYRKAKEFDSKIIGFETAIRRPYFHVRPLNVAELENWHNYLDFIEGVGDLNKVVKLYERCLIACANYPEYWIRYILCMEASGSMDLVDNALARATQVFVKRQPEIHLFAARFREQHGDIAGARAAYQLVHTEISPGLLEAIIKHANMENRLGNLEDACSLYEQAIAIEKAKEHSQTLPLLFAQFARFIFLVSGKVEKAREILDQAVENAQLSKPLLQALIHLESVQSLPKRIDYLDSLVDKFVVANPDSSTIASIADREEVSSVFLEFLDLFGDAESIKKADDRHAKLFLPHRSASESKKRHAEDYLSSDKTKLAKAGLASSVMGAYPSAQNQWPAGYGVPQGWPQGAQSQVQQWTPGYNQQAAYGAYGASAYGSSYPQTQVHSSVPQTAGFAAYPPTYPAQAFGQQSYAQPAAAATLTPAQQSTASSAYYGSYY